MTTMDTAPEREPLELRVELHPFLVGLHSHHIRLLADCAMARSFDAGEYLFRQGEFANRFYLIEEGMVVLEALNNAGTCVVVENVGAGKLVGWSWLFPPYIWHFDARATEPTSALFFYGYNPARILRQGSVVRLRTFQKDEPSDDRALAVRPRTPSQQPFHARKSEEPGEATAVRREWRGWHRRSRVTAACRTSLEDRKQPTGFMNALPNENRPRQQRSSFGEISRR